MTARLDTYTVPETLSPDAPAPDGPAPLDGSDARPSFTDPAPLDATDRRVRGAWSSLRALGRAGIAVLRRPGLLLAVLFLLLVVAWALAPGVFASQDPITGVPADRLQAPSGEHLFGTDHLGRDVYARVVHGSWLSLSATVIAVALGLSVGSLLGLLAGFLRGWVDDVVGRVVDVLLAVPSLLLSLAIITVLGFGTVKVAIAVGITTIAAFARVMRAEALRTSSTTYVEAARASGVRWYTVLRRHVLPNSAGPVVALTALELGSSVLAISALSFLGYGAAPPTPEWGALVSGGRDYLAAAWWLTTLPGLVIVAVVLSANRVSRSLEKDGEDR
ncbi:ABC transporter permease [Oerskovia paurometabola]|uniref:ABC transporter permease n=1 Tax=Oerskovia paurometabola TaxID=162170 RepID=A0ABW1X7A2_9CELL|nr:ABC transporter permease [Oerskovia paurometabola]MBM7497951.1 peptide/nickel transport system permease protein [Oerskovia paurometabola]